MRALCLFLCLGAVLAVAAAAPEQSKRCADNTRPCKSESDCCSGCCSLGVCSMQDQCSASNQQACAVHYCPPDKECYLQTVQCFTAPCPPIAACRPKNSQDYDYE